MAIREECKHYQSRTYPSGEVARFCLLDLAPDAPWRCPDDCPSYQRRLADVGWEHGTLIEPAIEDEPPENPDDARTILSSAEDIVSSIEREVLRDVEEDRARQQKRFWRRRRSSGPEGDRP